MSDESVTNQRIFTYSLGPCYVLMCREPWLSRIKTITKITRPSRPSVSTDTAAYTAAYVRKNFCYAMGGENHIVIGGSYCAINVPSISTEEFSSSIHANQSTYRTSPSSSPSLLTFTPYHRYVLATPHQPSLHGARC